MNACYIRFLGDELIPSEILEKVRMVPSLSFRHGEIRTGRIRPSRTGGLTFDVGRGSLEQQIESAIAFLTVNQDDLKYLSNNETIESCFLELSIECRIDDSNVVVQRDFLPKGLLQIVGEVGLGICINTTKPMIAMQ